MGKNSGKKKTQQDKSGESNPRKTKVTENGWTPYDKDTVAFISMSQELKEEGTSLFQKRDYEGAMLKYEKAIKLLPRNHVDVSYLRSNIAACYMQLGITEYPRAIHECNLALEVTPNYSKALLKRARCYEALNRLDLALRDVGAVLKREPNNLVAIDVVERVKRSIEKKGLKENEIPADLVPLPEYLEPSPPKSGKEKVQKKKINDAEEEKVDAKTEGRKGEKGSVEKEIKIKTEEVMANVDDVVRKNEDPGKEKVQKKKINDAEEKKVDAKKEGRKGKKGSVEKETKIKTEEVMTNLDDVVRRDEDPGKEKVQKKKINDAEEKKVDAKKEGRKGKKGSAENEIMIKSEEKKAEDKLVVEEHKISNGMGEEPKRSVKLVFGEDIRWAKIPFDCSILKLKEIIADRFPSSKAVLVKYRDQEGDLVTITSTEELRLAESSTEHGSVKLYVVEVNTDQDALFRSIRKGEAAAPDLDVKNVVENGHVNTRKDVQSESVYISDWIVQFAQLFKSYVGFDNDTCLDLHKDGMKLYSDALEEAVTSEEAQELFCAAADKFQEMSALALFNWGNVHMSKARKRVNFTEDSSRESVHTQIKSAYDWAEREYINAGKRYEEALRVKPNFHEAVLALGQQQFELAKLSWQYAISTNVDLELWPSTEVLQLYNKAEDNIEKGFHMWEDAEKKRVNDLSLPNRIEPLLQKMKLDDLMNHVSADEASEQAANIRSQIHILWGTILYERSNMEFKLGVPVWHECLEFAVEKFELAGASLTDIAVMIKNHCSNDTASEGLGFNIDEIVEAWNEMDEAKKWQKSIPSFRLEPLLRRRVSKLYHALEHV